MVDKNLQPAQEERHQFRRRPLQAKVYAACVCTLVEPTISVHSHSLASKFTHVRPNGVGVQKHVWVVLERKKKKKRKSVHARGYRFEEKVWTQKSSPLRRQCLPSLRFNFGNQTLDAHRFKSL